MTLSDTHYRTSLRSAVNLWDRHVATRDRAEEDADLASGGTAGGAAGGLASRWEAWEGKGSLLLHADLVADVLVHSMTLAHYLHIWWLHGVTFQLIDAILFLDIRSILVSLAKRVRSYLAYREATHSLKHAFPDAQIPGARAAAAANATGSEGQAPQEQCAICMERMAAAKQLPCGHMFHLPCLRAWLQQSGTESFACPLCRTPLLRPTAAGDAGGITGIGSPTRWGRLAAFSAEAIGHMASRMYLDVALALLMGLPLNPAALHHHHHHHHGHDHRRNPAAGARGGTRQGGRRSSRRGATLVEEVQESDTPAPAIASAAQGDQRRGAFRGFYWMLDLFALGGSDRGAAYSAQPEGEARVTGTDDEEGFDDGWTSDDEDSDDLMGRCFSLPSLSSEIENDA